MKPGKGDWDMAVRLAFGERMRVRRSEAGGGRKGGVVCVETEVCFGVSLISSGKVAAQVSD